MGTRFKDYLNVRLFANQGNTTCQIYRNRQKQTVRQTDRQTKRLTYTSTEMFL